MERDPFPVRRLSHGLLEITSHVRVFLSPTSSYEGAFPRSWKQGGCTHFTVRYRYSSPQVWLRFVADFLKVNSNIR